MEASILVISGQQEVGNERLCAVEPHLRLKRDLRQAGMKPGATGSARQRLIYGTLVLLSF